MGAPEKLTHQMDAKKVARFAPKGIARCARNFFSLSFPVPRKKMSSPRPVELKWHAEEKLRKNLLSSSPISKYINSNVHRAVANANAPHFFTILYHSQVYIISIRLDNNHKINDISEQSTVLAYLTAKYPLCCES